MNSNYDWEKDFDWYIDEYVRRLPNNIRMDRYCATEIARVIFTDLLQRVKDNKGNWTRWMNFKKEIEGLRIPFKKETRQGQALRVVNGYIEDGYLDRSESSPSFYLNEYKFEEIKREREKRLTSTPSETNNPRLLRLLAEKEFIDGEWEYEVSVRSKRIDAVCVKDDTYWAIEEDEKLNWHAFGEVEGKALLYGEQRGIEEDTIKKAIVCKYGDEEIEDICKKKGIKIFIYPDT
jgi:hypothetical protein